MLTAPYSRSVSYNTTVTYKLLALVDRSSGCEQIKKARCKLELVEGITVEGRLGATALPEH